mgnify:CR=1 FL=1
MGKQLRLSSNKMLTGTAAGLAEYIGIDATMMRVIFAVAAFAGTVGIWIYLIAWIVMAISNK